MGQNGAGKVRVVGDEGETGAVHRVARPPLRRDISELTELNCIRRIQWMENQRSRSSRRFLDAPCFLLETWAGLR